MSSRNPLRPSLIVTVSQRLAMTPSLLQKIELLTLNQLELCELMTQELTKNPFLEEIPEGADSPDGMRENTGESGQKEEPAAKENDDFDYEYFFGEYLSPPQWDREYEIPEDKPSFEAFLTKTSTLADYLSWQVQLTEIPEHLREAVEFLVGNINADGYRTVPLQEAGHTLQVPEATMEEALSLVQTLDPPGVGARDLQECLLLQLRLAGLENSLAAQLVRDHLPELEKKKYKDIARRLRCSLEEVGEALAVIRRLSPKPGSKYGGDDPQYIRPDVLFQKVGDEYLVILNDDGMPHLRVNRAYRRMLLKGNNLPKEAVSYVRERFRSALELLRSIDQRQQTIYRVCRVIVERQREFLDQGWMYLRPLLIKDVAHELEVHPSTISRVVSNKYAHTPQGVIELRRFFTLGVENADGETVSSVYIKEKIKQIVDLEDRKHPLSDQKIAALLSQQGIQITRRTVAKYRDQIGIAGSRERKASLF
ncbi:MAG TPA: RNA polymerase factor sigma-54 [Acidobacteriota bacterium]|nr:RNA polymerase factor sigma-54 [Acidobacteriota bacterium]